MKKQKTVKELKDLERAFTLRFKKHRTKIFVMTLHIIHIKERIQKNEGNFT